MWPNLSQVLSCTEEGMHIGERGEVMSNFLTNFTILWGILLSFLYCLPNRML